MNRFPIMIRLLFFVFGIAALCLLGWAHASDPNHHLILQIDFAMGGAGTMLLTGTFWPREEKVWQHKMIFGGMATFLIGVTWMMSLGGGPNPFPSFPSFLFFASIALGIAVLLTPKRVFQTC